MVAFYVRMIKSGKLAVTPPDYLEIPERWREAVKEALENEGE